MMKTIGIIGFGNMGSAIAKQLKNDYGILVFDKDKEKTKNLSGINAAASLQELTGKSAVIIIATKPQDIDAVLSEMKNSLADKLIISIAAGISCEYLEKALGVVRVVRAMPNMPAKIGEGMTCLSKGKFSSRQDCEFAENIFGYLGEVLEIDEGLMNAATAVSGSGPAYVCNFLESGSLSADNLGEGDKKKFLNDFQAAAVEAGFNGEQAYFLTANTTNGTLAFIRAEKIRPAELIKQVASKGGTTEAALSALESGGSLKDAVMAAKKRADELSKKE